MADSRYNKTSTTRLPRQKRVKYLRGSGDDEGLYVKCWNCGFPVKIDRDLGDADHAGISVTDFADPSSAPASSGDKLNCMSTLDLFPSIGCAVRSTMAGAAVSTYYTPRVSTAVQGCKFCGCTNVL